MKELVVCTLVLWTSTGISLDGWLIFAFQSTYVTPPSRPYVDCSDAGTNTLKKVDHNHEHITLEHNHNSKVFVDLAGHQSLFLRSNFTADRQVSLGCHKGSARRVQHVEWIATTPRWPWWPRTWSKVPKVLYLIDLMAFVPWPLALTVLALWPFLPFSTIRDDPEPVQNTRFWLQYVYIATPPRNKRHSSWPLVAGYFNVTLSKRPLLPRDLIDTTPLHITTMRLYKDT